MNVPPCVPVVLTRLPAAEADAACCQTDEAVEVCGPGQAAAGPAPLLSAAGRQRCWNTLAFIYLALAVPWVVSSVLLHYFIEGIGDVQEKWCEVLPGLGKTPGRAISMGVHFLGGSVITLLGVWQVCPVSRRPRCIKWHRVCGRIYVVCAVVTALGGLAFTAQQGRLVGGWAMTQSFSLYGLLVMFSAVKAWLSARRGDIESHKRWALHTFALGIASFLYRVYTLLGMGLHLIPRAHFVSGGSELYQTAFMQVNAWAFYLPNLLVIEWLHRARESKFQKVLLDLLLLSLALGFLGVFISTARHFFFF
mmetsp:Transcript_54755/g.123294  ORF Transcript_54755/g.123294 Transcript_54755/m.123294 type:complete len:307 (-) Transcript_54755:65-985(-)|eukprot:CAMPEP_0197907072 /NCGR_PEP_ID=MMETSP1439-20131203/64026_1 /TAXON_ID=66791 /ORGANISM="Gonyaulax spinifera, Strain CCMP409" /LENGTH=306 /DNA_ID=CAMNT_0043528477 /DNA_START=44 /DNA_END=964 /DNA_ORIENTATION=+